MTKEEAPLKIEELKKYVANEKARPSGIRILNQYDGTEIFVSTKTTIKEAVLEALASGADLSGAELNDARFYGKGGTVKLKKNQVTDFLNALGFQIDSE